MPKPIDPEKPRKRASGVARVRKELTVPAELVAQVEEIAGPRRFNIAVEEALAEWVERHKGDGAED
jgi:hypothetical protein